MQLLITREMSRGSLTEDGSLNDRGLFNIVVIKMYTRLRY